MYIVRKTQQGRIWSGTESKQHKNYLELLTTIMGIRCFANNLKDCEILLRIDNTTAISYINKMGGIQIPKLNYLAQDI